MTETEARRYVALQYGIHPERLSALLDSVSPSTLDHWCYITGKTGHTSAQELRNACVTYGAWSGTQT